MELLKKFKKPAVKEIEPTDTLPPEPTPEEDEVEEPKEEVKDEQKVQIITWEELLNYKLGILESKVDKILNYIEK